MSWLLDTNTVSELRKPEPDAHCEAWLRAHAADSYIATITVGEIRWGIERMPEGKRRSELEKWFGFMMEDYSDRFYNFDGPSAFEWGRFAAELEAAHGSNWWRQFDFRDTQIGAIAREYGLTVATHNARHFPFCRTLDPFDPKNL